MLEGEIDPVVLRRCWLALVRRPAAIIRLAIAVLRAGLGTAWAVFGNRLLLEDNLNDHWFGSAHWTPGPKLSTEMRIREEHGFLRLQNRMYLVTRHEFPEPIAMEFDWSWVDLAGHPMYADRFGVTLRT